MSAYRCTTCGETVGKLSAARRHAKQGHKTQREAFYAGELHALELVASPAAATCGLCGDDMEQEKDGSWSHNVGNDDRDHEGRVAS